MHESFEVEYSGCGAGDEPELIEKFVGYLDRIRGRILTWNGKKFDMPVLIYRSLINSVQMPFLFKLGSKWESYRQRYAEDWHCDLMDVMSGFGASKFAKLDLVASAIGLPGKLGGDGSIVGKMYNEGRIQDIKGYAECDVLNLYALYMRWQYITGSIFNFGQK